VLVKQLLIGTFPLGHENVDLFALPKESGGYFFCRPDDTSRARIKVGLDGEWEQVVEVLLHEVLEMAMARAGCRFQPCGNIAFGSDRYHFSLDHNQFSEVCGAVAMFMTPALPKLMVAYKKGAND
jgi:hypothetical protein